MPSKNKVNTTGGLFDKPIRDLYPYSAKKTGDLGIEIEVEGSVHEFLPTQYWQSKPDGSLRQGIEFVLRGPMPMAELDAALKDFTSIVKGGQMKPVSSLRTSTHYHINVINLTMRQIYNAIGLYYLIEELIFSTQPPNRRGNLFCLRMKDSTSVYHVLKNRVRNGLFDLNENYYKYSALNLAAIGKYGSLEFRMFEAMVKPADIKSWAVLLYDLVHRGKEISIKDMLDRYDQIPVISFLREVLGENNAWLWRGVTSHQLNEYVHTNYDSLRELSRALESRRTYQLPYHLWDDDLDTEFESPYKSYYAGINFDDITANEAAAMLNQLQDAPIEMTNDEFVPE